MRRACGLAGGPARHAVLDCGARSLSCQLPRTRVPAHRAAPGASSQAAARPAAAAGGAAGGGGGGTAGAEDAILRTRTYDLLITYDKHYAVRRAAWLSSRLVGAGA